MTPFKTLLEFWPLVLFMVGLLVACGRLLACVNQQQKEIDKLTRRVDQLSNRLSRRLYDDNGETIFMPRSQCEASRRECRESQRELTNELKDRLGTLEDKLDTRLLEISETIGRVNAHLSGGNHGR